MNKKNRTNLWPLIFYDIKKLLPYFILFIFLTFVVVLSAILSVDKNNFFDHKKVGEDNHSTEYGNYRLIYPLLFTFIPAIFFAFTMVSYVLLFVNEKSQGTIGNWLTCPVSRYTIFFIRFLMVLLMLFIIYLCASISMYLSLNNVLKNELITYSYKKLNYLSVFNVFMCAILIFSFLLLLNGFNKVKSWVKILIGILIYIWLVFTFFAKDYSMRYKLTDEQNNLHSYQLILYMVSQFTLSYFFDTVIVFPLRYESNPSWSQDTIIFKTPYLFSPIMTILKLTSVSLVFGVVLGLSAWKNKNTDLYV